MFLTCFLAVVGVVGVAGQAVAQSGDFQAAVDWIYYNDGSGRTINYDFTGATMDAAGVVNIPSSAITVPASESGVTFSWRPGDDSQDVSYTGGTYYIAVPQALASPVASSCCGRLIWIS